jgi:hypothetical protein
VPFEGEAKHRSSPICSAKVTAGHPSDRSKIWTGLAIMLAWGGTRFSLPRDIADGIPALQDERYPTGAVVPKLLVRSVRYVSVRPKSLGYWSADTHERRFFSNAVMSDVLGRDRLRASWTVTATTTKRDNWPESFYNDDPRAAWPIRCSGFGRDLRKRPSHSSLTAPTLPFGLPDSVQPLVQAIWYKNYIRNVFAKSRSFRT